MGGGLLVLLSAALVLTAVLALAVVGVSMLVNGRRTRLDEIERLERELAELERSRPPREA